MSYCQIKQLANDSGEYINNKLQTNELIEEFSFISDLKISINFHINLKNKGARINIKYGFSTSSQIKTCGTKIILNMLKTKPSNDNSSDLNVNKTKENRINSKIATIIQTNSSKTQNNNRTESFVCFINIIYLIHFIEEQIDRNDKITNII